MANTSDKNEKKQESEKKDKTSTKSATKASAKTAKSGSEKAASPKAKKPKAKGENKHRPLIERTYFAKPGEVGNKWKLVDAAGLPLGRLSSQVAMMLMGKDKPTYTSFEDTGDFVLVVNASKVVLTGKKWEQKVYQRHSNYPGGLKTLTAANLRETNPAFIIEKAVQRMLPSGHMGRKWIKKLRVFGGTEHPHAAQKPETVTLRYTSSNKEV